MKVRKKENVMYNFNYLIMRKLLFCLLFFAIGISAISAKTYTVTFATENLAADAPLIEALTAKGFKVIATERYWQNITSAKVAELNTYDLLVITRQTNSTSYVGPDGTFDLWADVTTPIINMSQYLGRSSKMQWFSSESMSENIGSAMLVKQSLHPIFKGIALDGTMNTATLASPGFNGLSVTESGNGKVVASSSTTGFVSIAEWRAGMAFYTDLIDPLPINKGKRMWFSGTKNTDGYAYNATGIELFENAVEYMITGTVSEGTEPINSNKVQAEDFTAMEGISIEATDDTTGGNKQILFTQKGNWAEYTLDIEKADYYTFTLRASSTLGGDTVRILEDGSIIGHAILGRAANEWNTLSVPLHFANAGSQTIRVEAVGNVGTIKLNWFDYVAKGLGNSSLVFSSTGTVSAMSIDGFSVLGSGTSRFTLMHFDGKSINNSTAFTGSLSGNIYTLASTTSDLKFTYRIDTYPRHISLHLIHVEGDVSKHDYSLKLQMVFNQNIAVKTLSDLTDPSKEIGSDITFYWRDIWAKEWNGNRGSFILYDGVQSDEELDLTLAEIWSTEALMPKPAGQPSWTSSDILNWVNLFAAKFNNMTQIQLEPTSNEELYRMMKELVEPLNIRQVYLHNNVWREEYWLNYRSIDYVNTKMFPKGREDLKAFAEYLHAQGKNLALHSLSYGIGPNDPEYIVGKVDRRLAKWTGGTLASPMSSFDTRILYRPDSVEMPFLNGSAHASGCLAFNYMRIEEEIVTVESFTRTDKDVWVVNLKERGHQGTDPAAHAAGTGAVGLFKAYNKNFIPEFDMGQENSLSDELIKKYYTFVNDMGLDHLHFDGPEIHAKYHWSPRPMLDAAYAGTNHPTTTSRVGGNLDASFELEFSKVKNDLSYSYFPLEIGLRLHDSDPSNLASSFMGVHMHAAECILLNARRVNFIGIKNANGITQEVLDKHGLTQNSMNMFKYWQEITPVITAADINYISSIYNRTSGSNHYESVDALVLSKSDEDKYIFTPYHVLGYADGSTAPWTIYQEHGARRRSIFIGTDKPMALTNPKGERDLNVIIRVVENSASITNPGVELANGGFINFTGTLNSMQYLRYEVGDAESTICDKNWMPVGTMPVSKSNFVAPDGAVTATMKGTGGASLEVQLYVMDAPYVLATNDLLK